IRERDGYGYHLYLDPGNPWKLQDGLGLSDPYKWGFAMVAVWGSHLSSQDMTRIDISPRSTGNLPFDAMPQDFDEYRSFYNFLEGGDMSNGRAINPITGEPYQSQVVKRGDYTRVLAEFWADGPDSETPPGHWFTILNYVNDQPELEKKIKGRGRILSALEWDIKSYFALGGALHDAAIAAWGCKGYYDYVRPMSAIRYMADQGQSTDPSAPNYDPHGIPLVPGYIELVTENDPLVGPFQGNLNKIKLYTWKGPDYIVDPSSDEAGVDWILAEDWFPYQRPSFVTPPFAGYVSGHSTFSRAAAEVLTEFTGSEFFPGGLGVFDIEADEFLIFEDGPSENFRLEWATYRDASDQTSLSRIWGGIHPPIDDIPGRIMGEKIGRRAVAKAIDYFSGKLTAKGILYPNPAESEVVLMYDIQEKTTLQIIDISGRIVLQSPAIFDDSDRYYFSVDLLNTGMYMVQLVDEQNITKFKQKLIVK
ncbi:MAG: T9SS type A sorting domain-containing protein, partial [Flavobacteriaceae bacterium]|nr:T9SS type A sorting domain-containing protein [Flavobacteriaceae bacterium]